MPQGLIKTKRRIQSITSTKKITKAMNLVATVKLKRWKDNMENVSHYLKTMEEIISSCNSDDIAFENIEFKKFPNAEGILYVVVTSSLGLCGGYNYNILKFINSKLTSKDEVILIGTKGYTKLHKEDVSLCEDYISFLDKFDYQKVQSLRMNLLDIYKKGKYKEINLVCTSYKNSLTFIPTCKTIFPISTLSKSENSKEIIFEPNEKEVLNLLIPKYIDTLLYSHLVESIVCEQASRRNAMDSATDNAEDLLEKLQLEFNKARQQMITQEITEVVSGSLNK